MIRALIVDDEPLARESMRMLLSRHADVQIVAEAADGEEAIRAIREHAPDVTFLDVQMPNLDGFGVVAQLGPDCPTAIVFVSASDAHALRAFEVRALDYLQKPVDGQRLEVAVERVRDHVRPGGARAGHGTETDRWVRAPAPAPEYPIRLAVRESNRHVFVAVNEIAWVEAEGNYVRLHTSSRKHVIREALQRITARLDPVRFVRIHRSYLVNVDHISTIESWSANEYLVTLHDGTRLQTSRGYKDAIRLLLGR
ncbi:MAG: response regulator transcription factor [Gemmatimonadetes bacterium]|nr:response regulator transcription factor [Gemmatimonadota bacterium]